MAVPERLRQQPDGKLVIVGYVVDRYYDWYPSFRGAVARIDPYGAGSNGVAGLLDGETAGPGGGEIELRVRRTGGTTGDLSVNFRTVDGTARAGKDYVSSSGTVSWPDGDLSDRILSVVVLNSGPGASVRTLQVELSDSSGGLANDRAHIWISSSPPAPAAPSSPPRIPGGGGAAGFDFWLLAVLSVVRVWRRSCLAAPRR